MTINKRGDPPLFSQLRNCSPSINKVNKSYIFIVASFFERFRYDIRTTTYIVCTCKELYGYYDYVHTGHVSSPTIWNYLSLLPTLRQVNGNNIRHVVGLLSTGHVVHVEGPEV